MAARKRKVELTDTWKDGIRVSSIMNRLVGHVNGDIELTQTQINAAKIILGKLVPDVSSVKTETDLNVSGVLDVKQIIVQGVKPE